MILTSTAIKYTAAGMVAVAAPLAVLSEGMLTAILVSIPLIIAAVGVVVVNVINALNAKVTAISKVVDEVKVLTNGVMGLQKQKLALATGKVAEITGAPTDVEKAEAAKIDLEAHREDEKKAGLQKAP